MSKIEDIFKQIKKNKKINIVDIINDLQRLLLSKDYQVAGVFEITTKIKKLINENVIICVFGTY